MIFILSTISFNKILKRKMVEPTTTIIIIGIIAFITISGLAITISGQNNEINQLKTQNQILEDRIGEIDSKKKN